MSNLEHPSEHDCYYFRRLQHNEEEDRVENVDYVPVWMVRCPGFPKCPHAGRFRFCSKPLEMIHALKLVHEMPCETTENMDIFTVSVRFRHNLFISETTILHNVDGVNGIYPVETFEELLDSIYPYEK